MQVFIKITCKIMMVEVKFGISEYIAWSKVSVIQIISKKKIR